MRKIINQQLTFGQVEISKIKFDPKSRDDIPQILRGLQHIYMHIATREKIFKILEHEISPNIDKKNGRPGMELWKIFVMGMLRLNLNIDYDRLHELVNQHTTIRQMLGHGTFNSCDNYILQTLKDNVKLLTPQVLDKINKVVVECGHELVLKKKKKII
jgi:transposase, IS5 family